MQVDGTYETQSRLTFTAGREDHGAIFTCEAVNSVLEELGEEPMRTSVQLDITCELMPFIFSSAYVHFQKRCMPFWEYL